MSEETGRVSGRKDRDYNLLWYVEACLSNVLRLESYVQDAEREGDGEVAELFRKAQADSRKGAEMGKRLLAARLTAADAGEGGGKGTAAGAGEGVPAATGDGTATVPGEGNAVGSSGASAPAGDPVLPQDPATP
ncbi:hypothetical protein BX265_7273 [Streptomyces sp. TLI_235]|nr:hypothetical protein BX265_7273 [Streptomyces sp. TLI_235]